MIKYFKMGFQFPKLIENSKKIHTLKVFVYFILLTFIANFPLTWLTFEEQGSKINFIEHNLTETIPDWSTLPSATITSGGIDSSYLNGSSYEHEDFIYYFGYDESIETVTGKNIVVFYADYIKYIDINKNTTSSHNYKGFETPIMLSQLNISTGNERVRDYMLFGESIEKSFSDQIILFTVIRNLSIQFLATFIYIIVLSGIIQLFRFGFQDFLSYLEGLNFIILASTLPSVLALIFGLILPGFAPVVFNLVLGLVVMLVFLVFSRKNFS
ncbi:DUF1189 family protein [Acholeplasma laidlawii]|uniref:DUF1189 family protein n=1 Tax=Acholeplasma laidlawii TaxID=2148 RepID=UPI0018C210CC|nr:DUF1189 family protein [Acholeplasma laidlawii]MBG0762219.1 DUF1189 family protein [Acholeplasma laidlawii]